MHERQYRTDYYTRRRNHNAIAIDVACMILDLTQDYEYEEEEDEEVPGTAVIPHATHPTQQQAIKGKFSIDDLPRTDHALPAVVSPATAGKYVITSSYYLL